jgi:hypothetical protein
VRGDGRDPGRVDFVLQDVNFDRSADLRIAIGPGDEDGVAYRWFLFSAEGDMFAPTDLLDAIKSPVINATRKLVLGAFKDERGRTGRVSFKWREGKLEPVGALLAGLRLLFGALLVQVVTAEAEDLRQDLLALAGSLDRERIGAALEQDFSIPGPYGH